MPVELNPRVVKRQNPKMENAPETHLGMIRASDIDPAKIPPRIKLEGVPIDVRGDEVGETISDGAAWQRMQDQPA